MLRFRLLGPFEAFREDERIPATEFRTRQARCALKLLLSEHDRQVAFTRLTDTFWADADPETARNSLHVAVRTLRRVLEPELGRGSGSRYLATRGRAYEFVANGCSIDVDDFLARRQAGRAAEARGDARAAVDAYRSAMSLYRGEYISEEPDAEWVLGTRERLREAFLDTCERLAALLAAAGHVTDAVGVLERGLQADPLREELYLRLMSLHAQAGRRGHALATFERCRRIQRAQLGTDPGPALQRLRDRIIAGDALGDGSATDRPVLAEAAAFVGREREVAALREAWARSEKEPGHVAVVSGDAGAGKTRLIEQLVERLGPDARAVSLSASEAGQDLALGPLLASFAAWLDAATTREVERLGEAGPILASLLPRVRATWPDCPPAPASIPDREQVVEAFASAVAARARGRALVVLDDAHWADEDTLRWLAYQIQRSASGVLTVVAVRPGEGRADRIEMIRSDARRRDRLTQVELAPLSTADVERLVVQATESAPYATDLARRLHAATGGNALFVVETLRDLGPAATNGSVQLPIAANVREAIVSRVAALPPAARDVLGALAVVAAPCGAEGLAEVTGRPPDEVIDALDTLLARRLVTIRDDGQGYAIEHPVVSRVVHERLGPARREQWRRRAASLAPAPPPAAPISA